MDRKILLTEDKIPKKWYCVLPDLPKPLQPILNPETLEPIDPKMLEAIFPVELLKQEMCGERFVQIPEEVRDIYRLWRPTPMYRARGLEKALKTPAKIYYKYEGVSPPGSHKPNTAVAQAYYNMKEGTEKLTTETGAGQWGSSLAFAGSFFDIDVEVYMVRISYDQKPYRRVMMQLYGADVYPSPSDRTNTGKKILAENPDSTGSLGIAISEAVEACMENDTTKYCLGSVLNHVLMHQTVIGQEAKEQMAMVEDYPDHIIGCVGGGSSFALVPRSDSLRCINILRRFERRLEAMGYEMDYDTETDACEKLTRSAVSAILQPPTLWKEQVVSSAVQGHVLPCKATRHVIPGRPMGVDVPLTLLKNHKISLEEANARLATLIKRKKTEDMPPGILWRGRRYDEHTCIFADGSDQETGSASGIINSISRVREKPLKGGAPHG